MGTMKRKRVICGIECRAYGYLILIYSKPYSIHLSGTTVLKHETFPYNRNSVVGSLLQESPQMAHDFSNQQPSPQTCRIGSSMHCGQLATLGIEIAVKTEQMAVSTGDRGLWNKQILAGLGWTTIHRENLQSRNPKPYSPFPPPINDPPDVQCSL